MLYRSIGDIPLSLWIAELERVDSPMLSGTNELYHIVKGYSALALAQLWREAQYDTDRILLKWTDHNPFNMKVWYDDTRPWSDIGIVGEKPTGVGGPGYAVFNSYESAFREYIYRITNPVYKNGVYDPSMTLAQFAETFAPSYEKHPVTGTDNSGHYSILVTLLKRWGVWKEETPMVRFEKRIATNRLAEFGPLTITDAHFTIHENGNPNSSPYDEAGFVRNGGGTGKVMYHFTVGVENGEPIIVQIFPVNKRGKHAGNTLGNQISVAVETTQAPPGALSDTTQLALRELAYMLYTHDERIEGWVPGLNFAPERTRPHSGWPGANPNCPENMMRVWGGVKPVVDAVVKRLNATPNPDPGTYSQRSPIPELEAVINSEGFAPFSVKLPNGIVCSWRNSVGKVIKSTPRLRYAGPNETVGPNWIIDDTVRIYFTFTVPEGIEYGYTDNAERIRLADVERIG